MSKINKKKIIGYILAISSGLFWGLAGVSGDILFKNNNVVSNWLVPFRLTISGFLLLLFSLLKKDNIFVIFKNKRDLLELIIFAIFGSGLTQYSYFIAIEYSNPAIATVLSYVSPAMILLYNCLRYRKKPTIMDILSVILVIVGAFSIATHFNFKTLALSPLALFWGLTCALSFSIYTIEPQRILKKYSLTTIVGWGMLLAGLLLMIVFRPLSIKVTYDFNLFFHMSIIIVLGTVLGFCFYQYGVKQIGTMEGNVVASIEPVAATVFSIWILKIVLDITEIIGIVLIIISIILIALKKEENTQIITEKANSTNS